MIYNTKIDKQSIKNIHNSWKTCKFHEKNDKGFKKFNAIQ